MSELLQESRIQEDKKHVYDYMMVRFTCRYGGSHRIEVQNKHADYGTSS